MNDDGFSQRSLVVLSNEYIPVKIECIKNSKLIEKETLKEGVNPMLIVRTKRSFDDARILLECAINDYAAKMYVFRFAPVNPERDGYYGAQGIVERELIDGGCYLKTNLRNLADEFGLTINQLAAKAFVITNNQASSLIESIGKDRVKADNQVLQYNYRPDKISFDIWSFFKGIVYHNSCTWARRKLVESNIIGWDNGMQYDNQYGIKQEDNCWFLGSTPDKVFSIEVENESPVNEENLEDENNESMHIKVGF